MTDNRRFAFGLGAIALAALVIRVVFVVVVAPKVPALGDASAYHLLAEQLARGQGYIRPFDKLLLHRTRPTAEYPPLFPLLLAIPARLGAHSVEQQRLFVALVGTGTVTVVGLLGRRVASPAVGLVAAALAAVYPMLLLPEATLMAESLYVLLVAGVILLAYRAFDTPTPARFAALGVVIGLATLTRAEGALLGVVVVVPLVFWLRGLSMRERGVRLAIAAAGALLVVAPWTIRNATTFHRFVPVSNNVATLVDGANCDPTYHGPQTGLWRETFTQNATAQPPSQAQACFAGFDIADPNFDEAKASSSDLHDGLAYARHHAGSLPKVATVRVLRTWGLYAPNQQIDFESLEGRPRAWQLRGTVLYWIMLPFAVAGVVMLRRRRRLVWPFVASAVTVTVVAAATYGQQRFRIAAEPAILVGAAVGFVEVFRLLRTRASTARPVDATTRPSTPAG